MSTPAARVVVAIIYDVKFPVNGLNFARTIYLRGRALVTKVGDHCLAMSVYPAHNPVHGADFTVVHDFGASIMGTIQGVAAGQDWADFDAYPTSFYNARSPFLTEWMEVRQTQRDAGALPEWFRGAAKNELEWGPSMRVSAAPPESGPPFAMIVPVEGRIAPES